MYSVYEHTAPNGKIYIGITSRKCKYRWGNGEGYIQNRLFYKAIKKYGWENITHSILFYDLPKEEAERIEAELIKLYKSNDPNYGYNLASGGGLAIAKHSKESIEKMRKAKIGKKASKETRHKMSCTHKGHRTSEETKKKISDAQKGKPRKKHTYEWKEKMSEHFTDNAWNMKPICQYSKGGQLIAEFCSAMQAERETNTDNRNIIAVCKGKRKTANGYIWKYKGGV